ncbi:uncharacterized protein BCR38DRAFT_383290 [Pseudomassariella vexata]|uniref:LCCL domain-containing protein n=1 Tax=Pseudomassariella vexata TaxID=1141098 RepID=A0A1Y2ELD2_9PEZI|nr:uncharacterized protein BCR38DRAFT_383290 [Pseudomassariella vexata]ORY72086.1 hypothetical protein BCR38DRAFT_383290 [Pseudomassariella vexata]
MGDRQRRDHVPQLISDPEQQEEDDRSSGAHPDAPIDEASRQDLELEDDENIPTPRFMQDEGTWKRWKWVPYPVRKFVTAVAKWAEGPLAARDHKIEPLFPIVQEAPLVLLDRFVPKKTHRVWLFMAYVACWLLTFVFVMRQGLISSEIEGYGLPSDISCGTTYWIPGNQCGLDGSDCRPFTNSGFAFKCPANCASYQVLNPRAVGTQEVIYQPLIVGGPPDPNNELHPIYRGDSFICGSAIHAGLVNNARGGCGVVNLIGRQANYTSTTRNGITSIGFNSYFPLSFTFQDGISCDSKDVRWSLLGVTVAYTVVLSLFTDSAALFFFSMFVGLFWHVGMASDPPSHYSTAGLFSKILGRFLPAMFCAWVFYDKMGVRRTLKGLTAQFEKTILWLGGCWVGALTNYTFDFIPIQRLSAHDLQQQPGAKAALAVIIIVLFFVVVSQIWFFRQERRLIKYLKLYFFFIIGIIICLVLPDLSLRIHHYILALLLLPGTSMQTRPSLLYQGLLVGLFINGIARWGFDPFLQTSTALQGDAQINSPLPSLIGPVISSDNSSITFRWSDSPGLAYDGISALVNDVERFRSYFGDEGAEDSFVWPRSTTSGLDEYFRFAYLGGSVAYDYTKAGIWNSDNEWVQMAAGPSRIKSRSLDGEEMVAT